MGVSGAFFVLLCGSCLNDWGGGWWAEGKNVRVDEAMVGEEAEEKEPRGMREGRGEESECGAGVVLVGIEEAWRGGGLMTESNMALEWIEM